MSLWRGRLSLVPFSRHHFFSDLQLHENMQCSYLLLVCLSLSSSLSSLSFVLARPRRHSRALCLAMCRASGRPWLEPCFAPRRLGISFSGHLCGCTFFTGGDVERGQRCCGGKSSRGCGQHLLIHWLDDQWRISITILYCTSSPAISKARPFVCRSTPPCQISGSLSLTASTWPSKSDVSPSSKASLSWTRLCSCAPMPPRALRVRASSYSVGPLKVEGHDISGDDCMKLNEIFCILTCFFQGTLGMTDLVLQFAGPGLLIALKNPFFSMQNLRRLLVVDVPSSWDVSPPTPPPPRPGSATAGKPSCPCATC